MDYPLVRRPQLYRFPVYLKYLILKRNSNVKFVSPTDISKDLKLSKESIRKDFQAISKEPGIPKKGRPVDQLISDLEEFLGYTEQTNAILIGAGNIGKALLSFNGFEDYKTKIIAAYDTNEEVVGTSVNGIPIYNLNDLKNVDKSVSVAIIAVPKENAQNVADQVMAVGIKAIYSLSPVYIVPKQDVIVETLDIASSIAYLLRKLKLKDGFKNDCRY